MEGLKLSATYKVDDFESNSGILPTQKKCKAESQNWLTNCFQMTMKMNGNIALECLQPRPNE